MPRYMLVLKKKNNFYVFVKRIVLYGLNVEGIDGRSWERKIGNEERVVGASQVHSKHAKIGTRREKEVRNLVNGKS